MMKNIITFLNKYYIVCVASILFGFCQVSFAQNHISGFYANVERVSEDSVYIAIHNPSEKPVCLFTGLLHSIRPEYYPVDQMLYLHRYNPDLDQYNLSFVPLMPYLRYSNHLPVRLLHYYEEPTLFNLTYRFSIIEPGSKFIYPVSKAAVYKTEYIYDYYPRQFPFYNALLSSNKKELSKYDEYKPYIDKIKQLRHRKAPTRKTTRINVEFAIYLKYDIITYNGPDEQDRGTEPTWYSFYVDPYRCNDQLHEYITVSLPLFLE